MEELVSIAYVFELIFLLPSLIYTLLAMNIQIQEEQKVIEAKIRIQQQEIQDEARKLKKRQDVSSSRRMVNSDCEIQDEVKRLKKQKAVCSSSRIMNPVKEYSDIPSTSTSGSFPPDMLFYLIIL